MWINENLNPVSRRVGDCAVRAVAKALGVTWEEAYCMIAVNGFHMGNVMSANEVWGSVLRQHGFSRMELPECPDCMTVEEFAEENPVGTYILGLDKHTVALIDGNWYDIWDSGKEPVLFVWYRKE